MVELISSDEIFHPAPEKLLDDDEIIVIVDDSPEIIVLLQAYLKKNSLHSASARSAAELYEIISRYHVALVLLDIGLPDRDGTEILSELTEKYPDLGVIMVTSTTDIHVALDCLRRGADDYLTKPVNMELFYHSVTQTLKKRRLAIENRMFQKELHLNNLRTLFLHHLNLKINSVYLDARELNKVLQAILIGITSNEGLKFNRAFLALFDAEETLLKGELAIGPGSHQEAQKVWDEIKIKDLKLLDLFNHIGTSLAGKDVIVNQIVRSLSIPAEQSSHPLIHACRARTSILVEHGKAAVTIPEQLIATLGEDSFVIVPLYSPRRALGVIIADNFVTKQPIQTTDVEALELLAGQASLAIEHSNLYADMQAKINELELVTLELEESKDLLVESERYAALGQMSAQLVHAIRNPITSIGGTSRLLSKRFDDEKARKFLDVLIKETEKVESTLNDLFSFVSEYEPQKSLQPLFPLIRRSVMLFYTIMKRQKITYSLDFYGADPLIEMDSEKIRQVFLHLIRNGIEAMPDGGTLTLSSYQDNSSVVVSISDTGGGVGNDELEHVTDPFYTTKIYGTGMGLTLVDQILGQHDASFALIPNDVQGTTATVTFNTTTTE